MSSSTVVTDVSPVVPRTSCVTVRTPRHSRLKSSPRYRCASAGGRGSPRENVTSSLVKERKGLFEPKRKRSLEKKNTDENGHHEHLILSATEELQATLCELKQLKERLSRVECRLAETEEEKAGLTAENERLWGELDEARTVNNINNKRQSVGCESVENKENEPEREVADGSCDTVVDELLQIRKENYGLKSKMARIEQEREIEREEWKNLMRDMLVAVRVAERNASEAEQQLNKYRSRSDDACQDEMEKVWEQLLDMYGACGTRRNALLRWAQTIISPYAWLNVTNFSSDWSDGKALCTIIHAHRPHLVSRDKLQGDCTTLAVNLSRQIGLEGVTEELLSNGDWVQWMNIVLKLYSILHSSTSSCTTSSNSDSSLTKE